MKAMLLAAGFGTRLRPLTERIPKCMVLVDGKPILEHTIRWLRKFGITEVMINLHYLPQVVMDYFGGGRKWDVTITYSIEKEILGTAGGVKNAAHFFEGESFIVWYGDNLCACDLNRLAAFHRQKASLATIALYQREDVTQCGIVGLDADNRIFRFLEKPRAEQVFSHWVNAGIYMLEPKVLDGIPANTRVDFGQNVFPTLLENRQSLYGYCLKEEESFLWSDTIEDLQQTQRKMATRGFYGTRKSGAGDCESIMNVEMTERGYLLLENQL